MLIVPPCGPWEIYPRRRACNRLVSHSPATYQRRWSTCSDGCSTSNKTVDRHPFLTFVFFLFNSIQFWCCCCCCCLMWGERECCIVYGGRTDRDGGAFSPTVVVRRGFPFGLCSLPGTIFLFAAFGKVLCRNQLRFVVVLFECKALNWYVCFLLFVFCLLSSFLCLSNAVVVVIYQLTVMTQEIHNIR